MENKPPALGPRPPADRPAVPLSRARAAVLSAVESSADPLPLSGLAEVTGLHPNTLREHLEALQTDGLVDREPQRVSGRGRPAWLYRAVGREHNPVAEYAGLAAALAAAIHRSSPTPVEDAVAAGTDWGRELASSSGQPAGARPEDVRARVVAILDDMGFDCQPDPEHERVRLTRCPLLDAAQRYPDVVCGVHLGIARGALEEYGVDSSGTAMHPFAEPGACVLELTAEENP